MTPFNPVHILVKSTDTYEGTDIPKLTEAQVEFAREEFAAMLSRLAAMGMKLDYDHMNGGFYVRDFRLDWPKSDKSETDRKTQDLFEAIVDDGNIDIASSSSFGQYLPCFANGNEGFHLIDGDIPDTTLPY